MKQESSINAQDEAPSSENHGKMKGGQTDELAAVSELIMRSEDFRDLSDKLDIYCPFEALGVARQEIRHSNFLADIITPNRAHGFGDLLLKAYIRALLDQTSETALQLDLHLQDLSDVRIEREWKHIDLLIHIPSGHAAGRSDVVLVTEIKVESGESQGQLEAYERVVKNEWPDAAIHFFFLTPDRHDSSQECWVPVGFADVLDEFESALAHGTGDDRARDMVTSYIQMMRSRYVANPELENLARKIWAQHSAALEYLVKMRPNPASELLRESCNEELVAQINRKLEKQGLTIVIDTINSGLVRLAVKEWDDIRGFTTAEGWTSSNRIALFEVKLSPDRFSCSFVIGPGPQDSRVALAAAISQHLSGVKQASLKTRKYSTILQKTFKQPSDMEKILNGGTDASTVEEVRTSISEFVCSDIEKLNTALNSGWASET